jgi:hypothetical protein
LSRERARVRCPIRGVAEKLARRMAWECGFPGAPEVVVEYRLPADRYRVEAGSAGEERTPAGQRLKALKGQQS